MTGMFDERPAFVKSGMTDRVRMWAGTWFPAN